jgi:hypothetical protein
VRKSKGRFLSVGLKMVGWEMVGWVTIGWTMTSTREQGDF